MAETQRLRLGMFGGGAFGQFAVREFTRLPGVELVALAETRRESSRELAKRLGIVLHADSGELLRRDDVDMVYIATPPFLHHRQVMAALAAGKHVLCDKPLALNLGQADEMLKLAAAKKLVLATNLMQRYGAFFEPVRTIIERGFLGDFLHGSLQNLASDQGLSDEHWFWDRSKSGGIFVEHGVHFFDLFAGWFGEARVVAAQRGIRAGTGFEDQVNCTLVYPEGATVNFYHGFTQPSSIERLTMELSFERGSVELDGWIPTSIRIRGATSDGAASAMASLFNDARVEVLERFEGEARWIRSHGKIFEADQRVEITAGGASKDERYAEALRALLADQIARIHDPSHVPLATEQNGRSSLLLAEAASKLADERTLVEKTHSLASSSAARAPRA